MIDCVYCVKPLPEVGFYCPSCSKQARCKHCKELLFKDAKICIHCGEGIGESANQGHLNTIHFSESENGREFKATFTDTVGQSISEAFGVILSNKIGGKNHPPAALPGARINGEEDFIEDADAEVVTQEKTSGRANPELEQLKKVFKDDGEKISLLETRMKAASKRDYGIRLALLFTYYKSLVGTDVVPRKDLTAIMENASVNDANFRFWLTHNSLIGVLAEGVEIKAPGKDAARKFLAEIFNPDIKDGWQIGSSTKSSRKSKGKKSGE